MECKTGNSSVERRLRSRNNAGKIGIFAVIRPSLRLLFLCSKQTAFFLFLLLGLPGPLTIAFRLGCFAWSGDWYPLWIDSLKNKPRLTVAPACFVDIPKTFPKENLPASPAATAAASASASATRAGLLRFRLIDDEGSPFHLCAVQLGNRLLGLFGRGHLDEPEPARLAGKLIRNNPRRLDVSVRRK
jgi:hypothetical protein